MGNKMDEYVEKLKDKIGDWNIEIDKLQAKGDQAKADVRKKYAKQIKELKAKRKELEGKVGQLRKAGEGAWEDMKAGADIALKVLGEAVKSAKSRFK
jgi:phage host-nuclease inhibitor protein Gam